MVLLNKNNVMKNNMILMEIMLKNKSKELTKQSCFYYQAGKFSPHPR